MVVVVVAILGAAIGGGFYYLKQKTSSNLANNENICGSGTESCSKNLEEDQPLAPMIKTEKIIYATDDVSVCDKNQIDGNRDKCYLTFLEDNDNVSVCKDIAERHKEACYTYAASGNTNVSTCAKFPAGKYRNTCYIATAANKKDPSICENIKNAEGQKDMCLLAASSK